jgi:leucyl aminopeptidase
MVEIGRGTVTEEAGALVVGVGAERSLDAVGRTVAGSFGEWFETYLDRIDFTGKPGQLAVLPGGDLPFEVVVLVGLGEDPDAEAVRQAAGVGGGAVTRHETVATTLHAAAPDGAASAAVEGFVLGQYSFDRHRSEPKPSLTTSLALIDASDDELAEAERGRVIAEAVVLARDLVNESPAHKPPATLAALAVEAGDRAGFSVRVYDEEEAAAEGFGGLLGVAAGAANPPRMVEMRYEPEGAEAFLALVGKGIVFDSGGLSLKPADGMETMKTDMAGAAAVIGAMQAVATLGLPIRMLGITPLTENMPGGAAQRPGDVLKARNGKTIEVLNTDAEGRLVLADGLSLAAEAEPDLIVDLATLTGACMVALGDKIAGVFGAEADRAKVERAAARAGERVWPLPLPADYRKKIDSDVADMKNTGPRWGGAINAALLLKEFVGDTPWVHLDIAGPARAAEAEHYLTKGGTGFGVRTVVALAEDLVGGTGE